MFLLFRKSNYNVEALLVLGILAAEGQYHQALDKRGVLLIRRLDKKKQQSSLSARRNRLHRSHLN